MTTTVFLLAAGTWVGAIVFHSAVVAPVTFRSLPADLAGRFLRTLFPKFFVFGLLCGGVMLAAALLGGVGNAVVILTAAMLILQAVALAMVPAINRARDAGEAGRAAFGRLHGINVLLTVAVMLLGIATIWLLSG